MILNQQMELLLFIIAIGVVQISQVFIQNHSFDMFQINWHRLREYFLRRVSLVSWPNIFFHRIMSINDALYLRHLNDFKDI